MAIPQQLLDALESAIAARGDVDAAEQVKAESDGRNAAALAENQQAIQDLASKTEILDVYRQQLEELEDNFLRPGGTLPTPPMPATPSPATAAPMKVGLNGQPKQKV